MQHVAGPGDPHPRPGQVIGILGGSFDPPHEGHLHISLEAMKRFRLDQVWWLVSPGNPLKAHGPAELSRRMAAARALARHPRIHISDFEARSGTRFTAETIAALKAAHLGVRFVWLMGADNLAGLHRWERWPELVCSVPMGILARPGPWLPARLSGPARLYRRFRLPQSQAAGLGRMTAPAWCYLTIPKRRISSTEIRREGGWPGDPES